MNKEEVMLKQLVELEAITVESINLWKIEEQLSEKEWDERWDILRKRHAILGEEIIKNDKLFT